jgi:hypothetical protein
MVRKHSGSLNHLRHNRKPNRLLLWLWNRVVTVRRTTRRLSLPAVCLLAALLTIILVGGRPLVIWMYQHSECTSRELGIVWEEGVAHTMHRTCPPPLYELMQSTVQQNICITTLTDSKSPSVLQRRLRCRDFDAVRRQTWPGRQAYADKHGYRLVDASELIDTSRPPAWSKIGAVQYLFGWDSSSTRAKAASLSSVGADDAPCDWVFWMDADTVIMNSSIRLESLLPDSISIDLIATYDRRFFVNSGAWLMRRSAWSKQFLQDWWNSNGWVRRPGLSLSGDNAAFGDLVQRRLASSDDRPHIAIAPRCNFNSFGAFLPRGVVYEQTKEWLEQQEWYLSENFYHAGDFVAHASGIDQKEAGIALLLERVV